VVDGVGNTLTVTPAAGQIGINGLAAVNLTQLTVTGDAAIAGTITAIGGNQAYQGNVTLAGATELGGTAATFASGIEGAGNDLTLNFTQASVDGLANINNFTSLGGVELNGAFSTTGFQNYAGQTTLLGNTSLVAGSGFIKIDGLSDGGAGYGLTVGNATSIADVTLAGNTAIAALVSAPGNFNVSLTGTNNTLGAANFQHLGVLGIGDDETDRTFVPGGITAPNVSLSQLGGTFATNGSAITFNDVSLLANATLDSTNNGTNPAGANVLVSGGLTLNSYTLVTLTGNAATEVEGDVAIQNGTVKVEQGSLDIGVGDTSANVTFVENTTITVAAGGELNVGNGSTLNAGNNTLTLTTDALNVSSTAGNITGSAVTITPVTPGNSIHAGNATGPGLVLPQSTINKMQTPVLTLGGTGYNGTIEVQGLTGSFDRLNLIANGTGGAIDLSGGLNLSGKGDDGVSLFIEGSGATTDLSGTVNLAGTATIYDAVRLVGDASIVSTGGNVTITGGNTGIYSQLGNSYNLSIDAGIVVLGNQTGFGDNSSSDSFVGDLTVNATSTTFGNATQQIDGTLTVTGTSLSLENSVEAGGAINIAVSGTTTIVNDLSLNATASTATIAGSLAGPGALNISAADNVTIGGTAGSGESKLGALAITSANGSIETHGAQTLGPQSYSPAASKVLRIEGSYLTSNASLMVTTATATALATDNLSLSTGSGNISFAGDLLANTVGTQNLTVLSSGVTTFGGTVGNASGPAGTTAFNVFTTNVGGSTRFAENATALFFLLNDDVELLGNLTLAGFGSIITGAVDGGGHDVTLQLSQAAVDGANWSNLASLRFRGDQINLSNTITTTGLQEYNGSVVLSDNTTLVAGADVSVLGAVDGDFILQSNATGMTTFGGVVGGVTALRGVGVDNATTLSANVTTSGSTLFNGPTTLAGDVTMVANNSGTQFIGGVDGNFALSVGGVNTGAIFGRIGDSVPLRSFAVEGSSAYFYGNVTAVGAVSVNATVVLEANSVVTSTGDGLVHISGEVRGNGSESLVVKTGGSTIFGGTVSNVTSLTTDAGGSTTLNGNVTTLGDQSYGDQVLLATALTLNATGSIDFGSLVDGATQLTLQAGENVNLNAALGSTAPLQGLNLASAAAVTALGTIAIDGTGGSSPGLQIGADVDNVNISQPGSTISNAALSGILLAGNSTGSTLGGFTITNSGGAGISAQPGDYSATRLENNTITGSGGDGILANGTAGLTVAESSIRDNAGQGLMFYGATDSQAINNTIGDNAYYGIVVQTAARNVTITGNRIGVTASNQAIPNGRSGIFILDNVDGAVVKGNMVRGNAVNGIEVNGSQNITIGGDRDLGEENLISGNAQYGLTFTNVVTGSLVRGNDLTDNTQAGLYLNNAQGAVIGHIDGGQALAISGSDFGVVAGGDLSGTQLVGNEIQNNRTAGFQLLAAQNLSLFRNLVSNNGPYGLLAIGDSTGSHVAGNTIQRHGAGIWLAYASGLTIGSLAGTTAPDVPTVANKIIYNDSVGVVIQGSSSLDNTILSDSIYANAFYGIQMVDGAVPLLSPPTITAATTTQVTGSISGTDGEVYRIQYFKSSSDATAASQLPQGQTLIAYQDVTISGGTASINLDISSAGVVTSDWITATATLLSNGNPVATSAFSLGVQVTQ
jgi:hypothetical protein